MLLKFVVHLECRRRICIRPYADFVQKGAVRLRLNTCWKHFFFLDGPAKLTAINIHTVVSGRCRGVARDLYLTKNPLSQNHPLSVELVRILEESMHHEPPHAQCIVGQLLFCIHSCCRWKDAQRVRSITVERSEGESLLHADAISSKTSLSLDAKTRFLPYVALSHGILGTDWASHTVDSCKRPAGLIFR